MVEERTSNVQFAVMVDSVPEFRRLVEHLMPLPSGDLAAIESYVHFYLVDQQKRRKKG